MTYITLVDSALTTLLSLHSVPPCEFCVSHEPWQLHSFQFIFCSICSTQTKLTAKTIMRITKWSPSDCRLECLENRREWMC